MAKKLTGPEMRERTLGNLDGIVWALLADGVTFEAIVARVKQARKEYEPSELPAFIIKEEE